MADLQYLKERKGFFTAVFCCLGMLLAWPVHATEEGVLSGNPSLHVISDDQAGLALFGFDPVAYHVDQKAREGNTNFQLIHQKLIWRFSSMANMEAFRTDPAAYVPAFGGHDGWSVSQGLMTAGDPTIFLISKGKLIMFRSEGHRDQFRSEPATYQSAHSRWPDVVRQHASH